MTRRTRCALDTKDDGWFSRLISSCLRQEHLHLDPVHLLSQLDVVQASLQAVLQACLGEPKYAGVRYGDGWWWMEMDDMAEGDTLSLLIEAIYDLWWLFGLTHPCSTTLWAPDHSTSMIIRQCNDKGHISHPQEKPQSTSTGGEGGKGVKMGTLHWGGGGVPAKPGSCMPYTTQFDSSICILRKFWQNPCAPVLLLQQLLGSLEVRQRFDVWSPSDHSVVQLDDWSCNKTEQSWEPNCGAAFHNLQVDLSLMIICPPHREKQKRSHHCFHHHDPQQKACSCQDILPRLPIWCCLEASWKMLLQANRRKFECQATC